MSLGIAIFASVVLVLVVYNQQFRKVFFWIAGTSAVLAGLGFAGIYLNDLYNRHTAKVESVKRQARVEACSARFPAPADHYYVDASGNKMDIFDVLAECVRNPDAQPKEEGPWIDYKPETVFEIHGGETLRYVRPRVRTDANQAVGSLVPVGELTPLIYLGHHQKFVFTCGNYGEGMHGTTPFADGKGNIECK